MRARLHTPCHAYPVQRSSHAPRASDQLTHASATPKAEARRALMRDHQPNVILDLDGHEEWAERTQPSASRRGVPTRTALGKACGLEARDRRGGWMGAPRTPLAGLPSSA